MNSPAKYWRIVSFSFPGVNLLAHQTVGHHRRLQPAAGETLMTSVAQVSLVSGILRAGQLVGAFLVRQNRFVAGHKGGVLDHRHPPRLSRGIRGPQPKTR